MALATSLLWLVGIEALPAMHQEVHDELAPHTHGGTPHRHASRRSRSALAIEPATTPDDASELAHREIAIKPAPPPPTEPVPVDRCGFENGSSFVGPQTASAITDPTARGPPLHPAHVVASDRRASTFLLLWGALGGCAFSVS